LFTQQGDAIVNKTQLQSMKPGKPLMRTYTVRSLYVSSYWKRGSSEAPHKIVKQQEAATAEN
jgi:hypothetical protein